MRLNKLGTAEPLEFSFQEIASLFVQCKANLAQSSFNLTSNRIMFKNMLAFFQMLTYYSLSSTNPTEVSHFVLKKLILKSNNLPFFLKKLRTVCNF